MFLKAARILQSSQKEQKHRPAVGTLRVSGNADGHRVSSSVSASSAQRHQLALQAPSCSEDKKYSSISRLSMCFHFILPDFRRAIQGELPPPGWQCLLSCLGVDHYGCVGSGQESLSASRKWVLFTTVLQTLAVHIFLDAVKLIK